jgi:hypothetical protein
MSGNETAHLITQTQARPRMGSFTGRYTLYVMRILEFFKQFSSRVCKGMLYDLFVATTSNNAVCSCVYMLIVDCETNVYNAMYYTDILM